MRVDAGPTSILPRVAGLGASMVRLVFATATRVLLLGERARRMHSAWLTSAMRDRSSALPRIPTRRVDEGGFDPILQSPGGREWAEQWWGDAFVKVETYSASTRRRRRHGR